MKTNIDLELMGYFYSHKGWRVRMNYNSEPSVLILHRTDTAPSVCLFAETSDEFERNEQMRLVMTWSASSQWVPNRVAQIPRVQMVNKCVDLLIDTCEEMEINRP